MKKSSQMISAVALLATLAGSDLSAQQSVYGGGAVGGQSSGGRGYTLSGSAMFQDGVTLQPRFHTVNATVNLGDVTGSQGGGQGRPDIITHGRVQQLPGDNLADDIIVGTPFAVYVGPSASNPVLLIDSGIVPDQGSRVISMTPSLPEGMNAYFRNGDLIICVKSDDRGGLEDMLLVGPNQPALGSGDGATLLGMGGQGLTLSGQAAGSSADDDDGRDDTGGSGWGQRRRGLTKIDVIDPQISQ